MRTVWLLLAAMVISALVTGSPHVENKKKESGLQIESIEYKSIISEDDLMTGASTASVVPSKPVVKADDKDDAVDLMTSRSKREADSPSFDDIYSYIHHPSNELFDELTATATVIDAVNDGGNDRSPRPSASAGMKGIMNELKASKHHKLTRNDIRQLAKKAVILATLKKLKENKAKSGTAKSMTPAKPIQKTTPKASRKKHKKAKKSKKKHHSEKHSHVSESTTSSVSSTTTVSSKENEMSEDLSKASTNHQDVLTDDSSSTSTPVNADLLPNNDAVDVSKKSNIGRIDDSVANMFDDSDTSKTPTEKLSSSTGRTQLTEKVKSLRSFLAKADPAVIPLKFLPDLPSGLRMIGWKEMVDKKKKQLNELEATVGAVDDATETKPVSLNIDVEDQVTSKTAASEAGNDSAGDLTELTGDKKSSDPISLQHIGYLQRHIKGARSLRKLIAKTLVGHCKSTGKRIFDAFVAMDKALARAQTIATVIGKKFNIDIDRIDALVGDKEDQVVETFLKDIFTKI